MPIEQLCVGDEFTVERDLAQLMMAQGYRFRKVEGERRALVIDLVRGMPGDLCGALGSHIEFPEKFPVVLETRAVA